MEEIEEMEELKYSKQISWAIQANEITGYSLVLLKVGNVINLSWWWVMSPFILWLSLIIIFYLWIKLDEINQ